MERISLCSYTYNDARLLHALLAQVQAWPTQPDEIILVDDGSEQPFALSAEEQKLPVRLMRLERNLGFAGAKQAGMNAASGDIIVSLDCDVFLEGDFLGNAARLLRDHSIGMVGPREGGSIRQDLLSKYLGELGTINESGETGEATVINGPALAIRRELWREIDGYSGFSQPYGEDHYLSFALRSRGYRLFIDTDSQVKQSRALDRHAFCRRTWRRCEKSWLQELDGGTALPEFARVMLLQSRGRCAKISEGHDPVWIYFELLQLVHIYMEFCNALGPQGRIPQSAGAGLTALLNDKLEPFPMLRRLLKTDLLRSGALPLKTPQAPEPENTGPLAASCEWTLLGSFIDELAGSLTLELLDKKGVQSILADEAWLEADFSVY